MARPGYQARFVSRFGYYERVAGGGQIVPAGWYADPELRTRVRYWNGVAWTQHIAFAIPMPVSEAPIEARNPEPHVDIDDPVSLKEAMVEMAATDDLPQDPDWRDLADNVPGQAVGLKADELRRAAPIRAIVARLLNVHTEERAFRAGRVGEREVARRLRSLGRDWRVLHAVPVGNRGSDIDHIVVGPGGVFTLNTKYHRNGRVWVGEHAVMLNGQKTDYLRNSRHEGKRASTLLSKACGIHVFVQPVIVVMGAELKIKAQPSDVKVIARRDIARWLKRGSIRLTADDVEMIYEQARRSSTWKKNDGRENASE